MIDADKEMHKRLTKSISERKYHFQGGRNGYNRVNVSEIKLYQFRCKKEVMPHFLQDLGVGTLNPDEKISFMKVIKGYNKKEQSGKNAFFDGRAKLLSTWLIQKLGGFMRIRPQKLTTEPERKRDLFVRGYYYAYGIGNIDDIARFDGNEEL